MGKKAVYTRGQKRRNCLDWTCMFLKFYGGVLNGISGALGYKIGCLWLLCFNLFIWGIAFAISERWKFNHSCALWVNTVMIRSSY